MNRPDLDSSQFDALRIAVEGCGHGTLDAIYDSVDKSCKSKGWDGVDLVIICGDFQAVRNHQDLNVTAMPAKYRKMGDFHKYYHGTKTAPYLTIFIGGNHEASNHLFELYYGGWAAPNIYYLGAANVIKVGPITIAATSGVYKKYDYTRPHFERLPYNSSEIRSIYHQRELDIRKLCSYRSQVDIGLSHDWPRGVEWSGDHKTLFSRKSYLRAEAEAGELGSAPSSLVLERLRPPYWFAAHHHYRYSANVRHKFKILQDSAGVVEAKPTANTQIPLHVVNPSDTEPAPTFEHVPVVRGQATAHKSAKSAKSAWHAFKNVVEEEDAQAEARDQQALRLRMEEQERTGRHAFAGYAFEENFREVSIDHTNGAQSRSSGSPEKRVPQQIPQLDGACCSRVKRRRNSSPSDESQPGSRARLGAQVDGSASEATVTNPDAINIEMSDSESSEDELSLRTQQGSEHDENTESLQDARKAEPSEDVEEAAATSESETQSRDVAPRISSRNLPKLPLIREVESHESLVAETISGTTAVESNKDHSDQSTTTDTQVKPTKLQDGTANKWSEHIKDSSLDSADGGVQLDQHHDQDHASEVGSADDGDLDMAEAGDQATTDDNDANTDIPDDVRAQLAEMSSTFAPKEKIVKSPHLPFPADITNVDTSFLALGKVEEGAPINDFLQLYNIHRYDPSDIKEPIGGDECRRGPWELEYDPEWLAITRVFASELKLGGSSRDRIPDSRGETYYRQRILEEEKWVHENIVEKGLLTVPKDFVVQVEQQDWDALSPKEKNSMPRELTNPQTSQFCELVGIPNPFDISEEERDALMERGPATDDWQQRGNNRGRGGNRGGRGGRGGFGGRGRGGGGQRGRGGIGRG